MCNLGIAKLEIRTHDNAARFCRRVQIEDWLLPFFRCSLASSSSSFASLCAMIFRIFSDCEKLYA